jgi:hypothetical protein
LKGDKNFAGLSSTCTFVTLTAAILEKWKHVREVPLEMRVCDAVVIVFQCGGRAFTGRKLSKVQNVNMCLKVEKANAKVQKMIHPPSLRKNKANKDGEGSSKHVHEAVGGTSKKTESEQRLEAIQEKNGSWKEGG